MTFGQSIKTCFRKYAVFKGRAMRSEYWWFELFYILISIGLHFLTGLAMIPLILKGQFTAEAIYQTSLPLSIVSIVVSLAFLLPSLAVMTRRLHDVNKSGWWLFIYFLVALIWTGLGALILTISVNGSTLIDEVPFILVFGFSIMTIIVFAIAIVFLVWCLKRGTIGPNKYGPDPLADTYAGVVLTPES